MEENTRTKLLCGLLDASKLVPKLESMLRRLRAISILLMMRRDNTRSKIIHTIHSFQEQLAAFEKRALDEMEEVFSAKSEYLDMYRESVTCDIESLRSLSSEVESLLRFTSGPSLKNHEVHAKRLIEVFSLVLNNNVVDLDVDDDIDCLDFVQNMEAEVLLNLGKVVSSYNPENCPQVAVPGSPNESGTDVDQSDDLDLSNTTNKSESDQKSPNVTCLTDPVTTKTEQLTERKFKLAGKRLKNLHSEKSSRDIVLSDEQEKVEQFSERKLKLTDKKLKNLVTTDMKKSSEVSRDMVMSDGPEKVEQFSERKLKHTGKKLKNLGTTDMKKSLERDMVISDKQEKGEQIPERKFKLAGKKLKNLGRPTIDIKKSSEGPKDLIISDEQDKIEVSQPLTYSSVVKCENAQVVSGVSNKDHVNNTEVEEFNMKKPIVTSQLKETEQEVQYVSSEDRKRWRKSLDDMLTNVPKPAFKVAAELLMNISKDSKESSDLLTQEADEKNKEVEEEEEEEEGEEQQQEATKTSDVELFLVQTANICLSKEAKEEINDKSSMQSVLPNKEIMLAHDENVVMEDMVWEEEMNETVTDQVVPDSQLKDPAHAVDFSLHISDVHDNSEYALRNNEKETSPTGSKPIQKVYDQPKIVQESKRDPKIESTHYIPTIKEFIQKNVENRGGAAVPAKLEVRLGHPGRGSGDCLHFPIGVTTDLEGNILVTDTGNHLVKVFDKDGIFKYTIGDAMVPAFTRPSAIVVNAEGKIFVKDDICIHKFTSTGKYLCRLGARKFSMPYGLALTSKGDLVTLDVCPGNSRIFVISPDGFYGTSYPFEPLMNCNYESKCRFLAVHNDTLYVSDLGLNCVYITDLFGRLLQTIGHSGHRLGLFSQAAGIALDKDGHIIVADSRNERIQIFRPNGRFLGVLALSDPHIRPSGIHLTRDRGLVVVNFTNHEVRVYRLCVQ
ncbi:uncharacterized protein LOC117339786 [Pecten maximus]|uniref:uncharacterized protein LOC117339786 n=1 Tax=Pecten maximus TaxID=6579 RepID=UPI001458E208|nr:uncharacterized protein LOC117339786 [Pecten maximus]